MTDIRISAQQSALLIIDIQERLLPAMDPTDAERVARNARLLVEAAALFDVPTIVSEQYPRGLGPTVDSIATALEGVNPIAKTEFSCYRNDELKAAIDNTGRGVLILCGIEAHVCVLQTALDLAAAGRTVHVVSDGIASRDPANKAVGLDQMRLAGAVMTSAETVAFQWCGGAGAPQFRAISKLVR